MLQQFYARSLCLSCAAWLFASCCLAAEGAKDVLFQRIGSLQEIQGSWATVPPGQADFNGDSLKIDGRNCHYSQWSCAPSPLYRPVDFNVELLDGCLVLNSDDEQVMAKRWYLTKLGEHKCLVSVTYSAGKRYEQSRSNVLFFHPEKEDESKPKAEPAKVILKRLPPKSPMERRRSIF